MPAYIIAQINITDPEKYQEYAKRAGPATAKYGGTFRVRGGEKTTLEGNIPYQRIVINEFPDVEAAKRIWEEDDVVDVRYHLVRHDLMALMTGARAIPALQSDALILQRVTYLLWIAHKLERVADHGSNICERIVFILEGEPRIIRTQE